MNRNLWPKAVHMEPVIGHREILTRARADLLRELNEVTLRAQEEGLPEGYYAEERQALGSKISAVNTMIYYECGEF